MLKLGAQNISGLYVGGIKIKKAYLGGNLVYSASEPPVPVVCTVTLSVSPAGAGTAAGGGTYESGQTVTLTYTAADGYNFTGWYDAGGTLLSTANPYSFTAAEDLSITARAVQAVQNYTISASIDPAGSGTVTGTGEYEQGASVTLTAAAADGYAFTGWQEYGTVVSTDNPYTFTAAADRMFTAVFAAVPVSRLPEGYTEVEYISNGNSASESKKPYFKMPGTTSAVKMEIKLLVGESLSSNAAGVFLGILGYVSGTNHNELAAFINTGESGPSISYFRGASTTRKILGVYDINSIYTIVLDYANKTMSMNGNTISSTPGTTWRTSSNYIFTNGQYSPRNLRIYSVKMWDASNALVLEFVPCINPSGVVGMYDTVGKKFYTKQNTASNDFTPGPAV